MGSLPGMRTILNAGIAVGDLDAEDHGKDETHERENCQHVHMLVACTTEREIFSPEFHECKKGTGGEEEEQGDKHRR